ncbi:MAG: FAD-dependent oxidoreductase [Candidatus Thermoplasmatota archaeon]
MTKLLVVGGNAAGLSAASKAKRRAPELEVEVLEAGHDISYSACGIPYLVEGQVQDPSQLLVLSEEAAAERGIAVRTRTRAVAFNPYTKEVTFQGPDGRDSTHYDKLVLATGASPRNPFAGGDLEGVFTIRHVGDGVRLIRHLRNSDTRRVAVIGGGYVGLEMASAFLELEAEVHLLARGERLLSSLDPDMTDGLEDWITEQGITLHRNAKVKGFAPGADGKLARVEAAEALDVDLAIVAVGVEPNTAFAVKAGVHATKTGHILVDDQMKTNFHDVWAAGDCVAPRHLITGRPTAMALALPSNRMGKVAGDNVAAGLGSIPQSSMTFPGVLGTQITRVHGLVFAQSGITETQAKGEGIDAVSFLVESKSRAAYMPGAGDMALKLVAEQGTGKLLGCQIAGPEHAGLRINAAAVALQAGLTAKKLAEVETSYAPPFSPVYDPLIVAAAELAKLVRR